MPTLEEFIEELYAAGWNSPNDAQHKQIEKVFNAMAPPKRMWTGNKPLDNLRSKAAASVTGVISVSMEDLNEILPIVYTERR